mmetsp:Transcript_40324/g.120275  ORF Transcript_40324/g.120275 Transcript_40324/m.120275 type:complete len:280 (+) Transcript_40324:883-1722(+)
MRTLRPGPAAQARCTRAQMTSGATWRRRSTRQHSARGCSSRRCRGSSSSPWLARHLARLRFSRSGTKTFLTISSRRKWGAGQRSPARWRFPLQRHGPQASHGRQPRRHRPVHRVQAAAAMNLMGFRTLTRRLTSTTRWKCSSLRQGPRSGARLRQQRRRRWRQRGLARGTLLPPLPLGLTTRCCNWVASAAACRKRSWSWASTRHLTRSAVLPARHRCLRRHLLRSTSSSRRRRRSGCRVSRWRYSGRRRSCSRGRSGRRVGRPQRASAPEARVWRRRT